ncbi:MAG: NAD(P)-dependent oxidoreductase [Syntrophorhabdales bacterium]|jgi:3-hydroxyisobutyrate dehydrogenase
MKIGWIGLGHLGKEMAKRLLSEGVELVVWDRIPEKMDDFGGSRGRPALLVKQVDIVFLSLFDSAGVEEVLGGTDGLLNADCAGKVIVDLTTNHFDAPPGFRRAVAEKGGLYVESPLLGSVIPAQQGNLTALICGDRTALDRAVPLIDKFARTIFYFDEPGQPTRMKLINNFVLGCFMSAIAEALLLGEAAGLERTRMLDVLSAGAGSSAVLSAKKEKLANEDFSAHFSSALMDKDLRYLAELSARAGKRLIVGKPVKELFDEAISAGEGDLDFSAVWKVIRTAGDELG